MRGSRGLTGLVDFRPLLSFSLLKALEDTFQKAPEDSLQKASKTPFERLWKIPYRRLWKTPFRRLIKTSFRRLRKTPFRRLQKTPGTQVVLGNQNAQGSNQRILAIGSVSLPQLSPGYTLSVLRIGIAVITLYLPEQDLSHWEDNLLFVP